MITILYGYIRVQLYYIIDRRQQVNLLWLITILYCTNFTVQYYAIDHSSICTSFQLFFSLFTLKIIISNRTKIYEYSDFDHGILLRCNLVALIKLNVIIYIDIP